MPTYLSSIKHGNDTEDIAAKKFQSKEENQDLLVVPSGELILLSELNYMYKMRLWNLNYRSRALKSHSVLRAALRFLRLLYNIKM